MSAIRVICNIMNIVRGVSSLGRKDVGYFICYRKVLPNKQYDIVVVLYPVSRRFSFPESKHKPQ